MRDNLEHLYASAFTNSSDTESVGTSLAKRVFPVDFRWGAATSAFQIEGATTADGRGESIWDRFCEQPGAIADASTGENVIKHYLRYRDDVALLQSLGLNAYRFSISWPRVLPLGDLEVNPAGLDFYDRLVDELLAAGVEPFPTLYHWDLPQALQDKGGWPARRTAEAFADYAEVVANRLSDRVTNWMTINEPFVSADHGHVSGEHAPGHRNINEGLAAAHHLMLAHGLALTRIREASSTAQVGCVLNFTPVSPRSDDPADIAAARMVDDWENRWYVDVLAGNDYPRQTAVTLGWDKSEVLDGDLEIIAQPLDFLGVNFYSRQFAAADPDWKYEPDRVTDMGWEIHPPSLGSLLRWLDHDYSFPSLMVTENGAAMPDTATISGHVDDQDRIRYLHEHLEEVAGAIADGVPVSHYFVWSLLDNFEWAYGYLKKFGIISIDPITGERHRKASADWYEKVVRSNTLPVLQPSGDS